jgi:DNA processing protein
VVEGATGSGSMITAEHAMEFGRDVFALPGSVASALSQVPLQLVREGATLIRDADDLLGDLGIELVQAEIAERVDLDEAERRVLEAIVEPTLPDRLASALGVGIHEIVGVLMRLELRGFVRNVGGRYETTLTARRPRPDRAGRLAAIDER